MDIGLDSCVVLLRITFFINNDLYTRLLHASKRPKLISKADGPISVEACLLILSTAYDIKEFLAQIKGFSRV